MAVTFYLYLFILSLMYAVQRRSTIPLLLSMALMFPAVFAKRIWPMPVFGYLAFVSEKLWLWMKGDMSSRQIAIVIIAALLMAAFAFNSGFQQSGYFPLLALFYLFVPWRKINKGMIALLIALPVATYFLSVSELKYVYFFTSGRPEGRYGTGFGAIGWNKMTRNLVNFPLIPIMSLGVLAALMIPAGLRQAARDKTNVRLWLCFMPVIVLAAYMLLVAPRTTYRHYLPLIPAFALLASYGYWSLQASGNKWLLTLFLAWPALLLIDFELDFHRDPRREIVSWYDEHPNSKMLITFYAVPPPSTAGRTGLFRPEYAFGAAQPLKSGDYLILSENWYDTAFANELNGPIVRHLDRLIKTKPEYTTLYRNILSGQHPNLVLEAESQVGNFMPELMLHKKYYGTFQKFVGDLKIFRIVP